MQVCPSLSFSKLYELVCSQPPLTHRTSAQTCNTTHRDFFPIAAKVGSWTQCQFVLLPPTFTCFQCDWPAEPFQMARVGSGRAASDILSGQMDQTMHPDIVSALAKIWLHDKLPGNFCLPACVPVPKRHLKE